MIYGTPVAGTDSLTYGEMQDVDTLHLLLPRVLVKVVHDTIYVQKTDTVYINAGGTEVASKAIGKFTVNAEGAQVGFSKGNLQYNAAENAWRFDENQYDYVGADNANISDTYAGWIDLFGWGTGANPAVSDWDPTLDAYSSFVEWGNNKIGNDQPNTWRSLSSDEVTYMIASRENASSLRGIAQVNGTNGLILLPDDWTCPEGVEFKSGFSTMYSAEGYANHQKFTAEQWAKLEAAGAVFMPASGNR